MIREFNPQLWFGKRQLNNLPPHFIKATTEPTPESLLWVKTKLSGRYTILENSSSNVVSAMTLVDFHSSIYFEDPKDVMLYELRWSGTKNI